MAIRIKSDEAPAGLTWRVKKVNTVTAALIDNTGRVFEVKAPTLIHFWIWFPDLRTTLKQAAQEYAALVERCRFAVRRAAPMRLPPPWAMRFTHFLKDKKGSLSTLGLSVERPVTSALRAENLLESTRLTFVYSITHNFIFSKDGYPSGVLMGVGEGKEGQ